MSSSMINSLLMQHETHNNNNNNTTTTTTYLSNHRSVSGGGGGHSGQQYQQQQQQQMAYQQLNASYCEDANNNNNYRGSSPMNSTQGQQQQSHYVRPQMKRKRSSMLSHYQQQQCYTTTTATSTGTTNMQQLYSAQNELIAPFSPKSTPHHSQSMAPHQQQTLNNINHHLRSAAAQQQQQQHNIMMNSTTMMMHPQNLLQLTTTQNGISAAIGVISSNNNNNQIRQQQFEQPTTSSPRNNRHSMMLNMTMTSSNVINGDSFNSQSLKNNNFNNTINNPSNNNNNLKRIIAQQQQQQQNSNNPFIARNNATSTNLNAQNIIQQKGKIVNNEDQMYFQMNNNEGVSNNEIVEQQQQQNEGVAVQEEKQVVSSSQSPVKTLRQNQQSILQTSTMKKTPIMTGGGGGKSTSIQIQQIQQSSNNAVTQQVNQQYKGTSERSQVNQSNRTSLGGGGGVGQSSQNQQQQYVIISVSNQGGPPNLQAGAPNQKKTSGLMGSGGGNSNGSSQNQNGQDHKDPKQALLMSIQEVVRLVIQRSEDINQLRQVIDLKAKKLKSKYTDSSFFYNLLQREWQRQSAEGYHLNKTSNVRVEDKSPLIKTLQKQVKKMLKPFNRRKPQAGGQGNDDYLNSEVHLSEILLAQDGETNTCATIQARLENCPSNHFPTMTQLQAIIAKQERQQSKYYENAQGEDTNGNVGQPPPQYKELRKRNMRIIQASFKEQLVDPQVALSICIQASRQAFFEEITEYFLCAHEIIIAAAPGSIPSNCNIQTENFNYQNLKKVIHKARLQARVQINLQKKLDKVFKVLHEQNSEILKQINTYKDKFHTKRLQQKPPLSESPNKANHKKLSMIHESTGIKFDDRRNSQPPPLHEGISPNKAQRGGVDLNESQNVIKAIKVIQNESLNNSQRIAKNITQTNQVNASMADFGLRPLNTTMSSFVIQTPNIKKSVIANNTGLPIKQTTVNEMTNQSLNGSILSATNSSFIATQNSILKGSSRISKLQPIVARDTSIQGMKRLTQPMMNPNEQNQDQMITNSSGNAKILVNNQEGTMTGGTGAWDLNRTIKKANQLPALHANSMPIGNQESISQIQFNGQNPKMQNLSRRGLDPIPQEHHFSQEQKVATLRHQGEAQSVSPLKRRAKIIIQGLSRVGGNGSLEDSNCLTSPLLKVIHTSNNENQNDDDLQSMASSKKPESSRKVIKATITIPLPKADLGVFRIKRDNGQDTLRDFGDDQLGQGSLLLPYDDDDEDVIDNDQQPFSDDEEILESPDITIMREDNQTFRLMSNQQQPKTSMANTTNHLGGQLNRGTFGSQQSTGQLYTSSMAMTPSTLNMTPSNIFKTQALLFDMSQFPINDRFDSLFSRYFNKRGILAFIVNHRARVLQRFFRDRMLRKLNAKRLIVKRFRLFIARQQRIHLFATRLFVTVTQKKAVRAIERAYIRYRDRLRSTLSKEQSISLADPANKAQYVQYIVQIVKLQRFYRKRMYQRFALGRRLVKRKDLQSRIFQKWQQQRYIPMAGVEAKMLELETKYTQEKRMLEEYVYKQQEAYMVSLYKYDEGLVKVVESNYKEKDWSFNGANREWTNDKINVTFKGANPANIGTAHLSAPVAGHMTPLQYLLNANRRLLLTGPCHSFEDLQGVSDALGGLISKEHANQRRDFLKNIKRQRQSILVQQINARTSHTLLQAIDKNKRCLSK